MAELATIARPYADGLYRAVVGSAQADSVAAQVVAIEALAADAELQQFAADPNVSPSRVVELLAGLLPQPLLAPVRNLVELVLENGRFSALPEIARQFHALLAASVGVSDAQVQSAFPIEPAEMARLSAALEKRFGRKLNLAVSIDESLIGGVRVVVGDEVLDSSVQAQLARMKSALIA